MQLCHRGYSLYNKAIAPLCFTPLRSSSSPPMFFLRRFFSGAASYPPNTMSEAQLKAQKLIREHPVVVFSKSYCPYCEKTKQQFKELGVPIKAYELDETEDDLGASIQAALNAGLDTTEFTYEDTHSSVPNIWIGKTHIPKGSSGFAAMLKKEPEKVQQLLQKAAAMHNESPVESASSNDTA